MSTAGLRIFNQNNILQIDQDYKNMFLVNKRVYDRIFRGNYGSVMYYSPVQPNSLIAFELTPRSKDIPESEYQVWRGREGIYQAQQVMRGDRITMNKMDPQDAAAQGLPAFTYRFYISTQTPTPEEGFTIVVYEFNFAKREWLNNRSHLGLVICDKYGDVVFDSTKKPLKVVSFMQKEIPATTLDNVGHGQSYLAYTKYNMPYPDPRLEKRYAICCMESSQLFWNEFNQAGRDDTINSSGNTSTDFVSFQESMVRIGRQCLQGRHIIERRGYIFAGNLKPSYMMIEVTNY